MKTLVALLPLLGAACVGSIAWDDEAAPVDTTPTAMPAPSSSSTAPTASPPASTPQSCASGRRAGAAVLRRLTATEYTNTVRDLLGTTASPGQAFPVEGKGARFEFDNAADGQIASDLLTEALVRSAEELSAAVKLDALSPCLGAATVDDGCAMRFIAEFGKRAFRRPLQAWESTQLQSLYRGWVASYSDAKLAVRLLVQFFLQSPQLLYRLELAGAGEAGRSAVALSPYEVATRLSYFLVHSMPDAVLFAAADAGQLATPDQVGAQARRLLATPRGKAMLADFHWQWLELDGLAPGQTLTKDAGLYKDTTAAVQSAMVGEAEALVTSAFDGGSLDDLLRGPWAFVNAPLATYYGIKPAAPLSTGFTRVDADPARAVGVLTLGALLATHANAQETSPIRRGNLVRRRFLCQHLEVPADPAIDTNPRPRRPGTTVRQWLTEAHSAASPTCRACHRLLDPVGLGFERFDAVGRWRDTEILPDDKLQILPGGRRVPVSDDGELTEAGDVTGPFHGVRELGDRLAGSAQVRECVVRQWFHYAHARAETDAEACDVAALAGRIAGPTGSLRDLVVAITQSDAFLYRPPFPP